MGKTVVKYLSKHKWDKFSTKRKLAKAHASILVITSTIGVLGNGIVLATYLSNYREMTAFRFLICHLAASDLLFATTQILQAVPSFGEDHTLQDLQQQQQSTKNQQTQRIQTYQWPFGITVCKFTRVSYLSGSIVAIGTILLIAAERYQGIMNPIKAGAARHRKIKIGLAVGLVWLVAIVSSVPVWIVSNVVHGECKLDWEPGLGKNWKKGYNLFTLVVFCLFPVIVLMILYGRVIKWLHHSHEIEAAMDQNAAQRRRQTNHEVIKILLAVVILFYVCVLPKRIMLVILSFIDHTKLSTVAFWSLVYCGIIPYPFHVALNPIIYSFIHPKFREAVINLFCRKIPTTSRQQSTQSTQETPSKGNSSIKQNSFFRRRQKEENEHELLTLNNNQT